MAQRVAIVGASGYGGAELLRLLATHPALEVDTVTARTYAGLPVTDLYPNLDTDAVFEDADVEALAALDLVFLATPHGASMELGGELAARGTPVVDLSGAFRLETADFEEWYGERQLHPEVEAVYGLTEWARDAIRDARFIANPGCYTTTALLGLLPLAGLVEPGSVVVDGKSGTSGAGRGANERLHHPHVAADVTAYGAPRHRHTIELERQLAALSGRDTGPVTFTPHLVPMSRGLLATSYAVLAADVGEEEIAAAFADAYDGEPFVKVLGGGTFPHTKAVAGSNGCQIGYVVDERTRRVIVVSVTDNLGKGAAGQALQNANLVLGLDETLGLTATGVYP